MPFFVGTQLVSSMNHACSYWSQQAMASLISTYVKKKTHLVKLPYILFGTSTIPKPPNENTALATVILLVSNHPHLRRHVLSALLRRSVAQAKTCPTKKFGTTRSLDKTATPTCRVFPLTIINNYNQPKTTSKKDV